MNGIEIPGWRQQSIPGAANLSKALLLFALLCGSLFCASYLSNTIDLEEATLPRQLVKWGAVLLLAVADGMLLMGLGVLAHDAVHRALLRSSYWNDFWGGILSSLLLVPFNANRQFHLTHHRYAHQQDLDPENLIFDRPFWPAATIGPLLGLTAQYRIALVNLFRTGRRDNTQRAIGDLCCLLLAAAGYFLLLPALGISLKVTVLPMAAMTLLVFSVRSFSDHYGIPAIMRDRKGHPHASGLEEDTDERGGDRLHGAITGWVVLTVPWLEWLWSHVNYHEVHHRYPYLSHRHLPWVFAATRNREPYLIAHGYCQSFWELRKLPYFGSRDGPSARTHHAGQ